MKYFVKVGDDDLSWGSQPKSTTTTKKIEQVPGTLISLINVEARLLILKKKSTLHAQFHPPRLLNA